MTKLRLSDDLSLPLDAVTQTFGVLAKRGVGKTYTASVMAEEMLTAGQQVVVLDPTGAWFGLRSSADGRGPGFPILVAGGDQGDIPLQDRAGEIMARAIVERRFSAVLDLSLFRKGEMRRFVTPFLETLYRLNREAVHLFVDEADDICPQKPFGEEAQMVGAMEDVVKRGRRKGIGCTLITQRPADLAKQVLTQVEVLVSMRLTHPRDIAAIKEWVNVHADPELAKEMIASLPALPIGTAWVWSPGWGDIFKRVKIRERKTFDSSATPKAGERQRAPKSRAEIDVAALGAEIAAAAEEAKANDPKQLKAELARRDAQIKQLEGKVGALMAEPAKEAKPKRVEVPVLKDGQIEKLNGTVDRLQKTLETAGDLYQKAIELRDGLAVAIRQAGAIQDGALRPTPERERTRPVDQTWYQTPDGSAAAGIPDAPDGKPMEAGSIEQRVLDAIAWWDAAGVAQPSRAQVAFVSRSSPKGGYFARKVGELKQAGLIAYFPGGALALTGAGRARAVSPGEAPTRRS